MPLVRVSLRQGKPAAHPQGHSRRHLSRHARRLRRARGRSLHDDLRSKLTKRISPIAANYLGIARSDDLDPHPDHRQQYAAAREEAGLFRQIVENLKADPGVRPEDVFINLVEVLPENWSFGNGVAQYVADKALTAGNRFGRIRLMIIAHYAHRLPADYDGPDHPQPRAARGHLFDAIPELYFKAFLLRERGRFGAIANEYSSLYLWRADQGFRDFLVDGRTKSVTDSFGRPQIETRFALEALKGEGRKRAFSIRQDQDIPLDADLTSVFAGEDRAQPRDRASKPACSPDRRRRRCREVEVLARPGVGEGADRTSSRGWRIRCSISRGRCSRNCRRSAREPELAS